MKYMMEEDIIFQSDIIDALVSKYCINYCIIMDIPLQINKIVLVASGSSYNAAKYGKYFFENIAQIETSVEYASEFCENELYNYDVEALYIFISQSGNSTDIIKSISKVKTRGVKTLCITNNKNSKLYELSEFKYLLETSEEFAVAATKTFSASVFVLWLIAIKIAQNRHLDVSKEIENIYAIKKNIENTLSDVDNLELAANFLSKKKDFAIVGQGSNYPLAKEAALKIKEINYIHTSAYPMGEFVHGHFALLNKSKVILAFMINEVSDYEKRLIEKIISIYKPKVLLITDKYEDYGADILIKFPSCKSKITNILCAIITVQLLALEIAKKLKRNPDSPKGLSKVVEDKKI